MYRLVQDVYRFFRTRRRQIPQNSITTDLEITNFNPHYNYQEIRSLGGGSFGSVSLVSHNGKLYAAKRISESNWNSAELWALRIMNHPNILKLENYYIYNDHHYLVTEYVRGSDLCDLVKEYQTLPEYITACIFYQLCHAIEYAHLNDIVHGDLKLENVFVDTDTFHVVLGDWGLSTICNKFRFRRPLMGTPYYVAPEMLVYDQMFLDYKQCDIWALGVILYVMGVGYYPFSVEADGKISVDIMYDHILQYSYEIPSFIGKHLRELIEEILAPVNRRLSIGEIIRHRWFVSVINTTYS